MWEWILDPGNQRNSTFFAGGAAAVVCALWAVFKFITAKRIKSGAGAQVMAKNHSIAAGGDITLNRSPERSRRS